MPILRQPPVLGWTVSHDHQMSRNEDSLHMISARNVVNEYPMVLSLLTRSISVIHTVFRLTGQLSQQKIVTLKLPRI